MKGLHFNYETLKTQ